jgi:AraC-like DNA-binding protein
MSETTAWLQMIYRTYRPPAPLRDFIAAFTYFQGIAPGHGFERFLPDGNVEIIFDLAGRPEHIYDPDRLAPIQTCRGAWASGVRTRYLTLSSGHKSELFVIGFRKGKAHPFFPVPMREMSDRVVQAEDLWGSRFRDLRDALLEAPSPEAKFAAATRHLLASTRGSLESHACVDHAVNTILAAPEATVLGRLYAGIGYSEKHFIRLFTDQVGVTPKTYLRLARFQRAVRAIETGGKVDWSAVADHCGFFDQAHFIHDFKAYSGFTPEAYFRRKGRDLNYVPVG